jgi:hypothetical protein
MFRTHATRPITRTIAAAGVGLLVAALLAGPAASAFADGRSVTRGTRAGRAATLNRGRGSGVSVGRGGLRVNVGGARIASPSARHPVAGKHPTIHGHGRRPGSHHARSGLPDHRNDAVHKLRKIRRERLHQNLLRRRPYDNLFRGRHDDRAVHDRFRHGVPGGAYGPAVKRRILRHRLHKYLPHPRRYVYPRRGSVIIRSPGVYYRSYGTSVHSYTLPGTSVYEERRVYVDPEPDEGRTTYVDPGPYLDLVPDVPREPVEAVPADHGAAASEQGWALLRRGRASEALTAFSRIAQTYRGAGVPKIGVALSLAMLEQFDRGAWAMRRALRLDPEAVPHVPVDEALRERLDRLVLQYRRRDQHAILAKDAAFMLGVLHALQGDPGAAREMLDLAVEVGDTSAAAAAFGQYLDRAHPRE